MPFHKKVKKKPPKKRKYTFKKLEKEISKKPVAFIFALFFILYIISELWQIILVIISVVSIYLVYRFTPHKTKTISVPHKSRDSKNVSLPHTSQKNKKMDNIAKGDHFERYVVDCFDEQHFTIVEWTTDMMRKHNRYVESDTRPDLLIRYTPTGEEFIVECKYRSNLSNGNLCWSYHEQMDRYHSYACQKGIPFFVVIGLGGNPNSPERMFCVPLEEARYPQLYPSVFEKYYHNPNENFFWNGGILK